MEKENAKKRRKSKAATASMPPPSLQLSWADRIGPFASRVSLSQASSSHSHSSSARKRQRSALQQQQQMLWVDKYAPTSSAQLCVAPKKVKEVRAWMEESSTSTSSSAGRMLVWVGSPGVGKSTTIRVLASELGWTVHEWSDSYSTQFVRNGRHHHALLSVDQTNALGSFQDFLQQTGAGYTPLAMESTSLSSSPKKQSKKTVILLDELPNLYNAETEQRFREIMSRHLQQSMVPTMLIFSDVQEGKHKPADLERLIEPHYLYSPAVRILQCNPVTKVRMKKMLESISKREGIRVPTDFWEEVHLQSGGDLRHAIMSLQFRGTNQQTKQKAKHYERDTKLSTFHALGKILYAKHKKDVTSASGEGRPNLDFDPEVVMERSDMEMGGSLTFLAYHCPDFFTDISELSDAFEHYSDASVFLDRPYERNSGGDSIFPLGYVASLAGRAVANFNLHPAPTSFRQFSSPKVFEVMRKRRGNEVTMRQLCKRLSVGSQQIALDSNLGTSGAFVVDALPYMRKILPREIDTSLDNLYSYVRADDSRGDADLPASDAARLAEEQRQILEMDDIVDDDSWEETTVPQPRRPPPQSMPEQPPKKEPTHPESPTAVLEPVAEAHPEIILIDD